MEQSNNFFMILGRKIETKGKNMDRNNTLKFKANNTMVLILYAICKVKW